MPRILTPGLEFIETGHLYNLDGAPVPGVTSILKAAGFYDHFGNNGADDVTEAMLRGTAVHAACHYDDEGDLDEETISDLVWPYLQAWRRFRHETNFNPLVLPGGVTGCEVAVASRVYRYACTVDRIGIFNASGAGVRRAIVEIKTGAPGDAAALQTAAQALVLNENMVSVIDRYTVRLCDDGTYRMEHYADYRRDFEDFLAALRVARRLGRVA